MTNMIQVCSNFHWSRVFIINARPDEISEVTGAGSTVRGIERKRERGRVLYCQPTGPNPLDHRDDLVDRPRAMVGGIAILAGHLVRRAEVTTNHQK